MPATITHLTDGEEFNEISPTFRMTKTLYIIDGHSHIYAAFYALRDLTSPSGEPTNATFGFLAMLLKLLRTKKPDMLAVAMDSKGPTFRHEQFGQYKANRPEMPDELACQIDRIRQIIELLHIPVLSQQGYEADDLIASLCRRMHASDTQVFICSKDKDFEQLISAKVAMYDAKNDTVIDADSLLAKKGLTPAQTADVLALVGDAADNIPGVPGIGPKKAAALIQNYGNLDNLLAHRDEVPGAMGRNLRANVEAVNTARQLIALRHDAELGPALDTAGWRNSPDPKLREVLGELGFRKLISAIDELWPNSANQSPQPLPTTKSTGEYLLVNTEAKFKKFLAQLSKQKAIALDTETTGLNPLQAQLVGISFSWQAGQAYYLPFRAFLGQNILAADKHLPPLRRILEDPSIAKYGHNIKYDLLILKSAGIQLAGISFDTMVASYLLEADRPSHSLKALGRDLLGMEVTEITELIGKGQKQIGFDEVPLEQACDYGARDADMTWQLQQLFTEQLGPAGLEKLFHDVEMPLVEVLAQMEYNGIKLDEKILRQMSRDLEKQSQQLLDDIHRKAGETFNVDSPQQLAQILFNKLGLKPVRKTKTGFSTDVSVLEKLRESHPLPALVLQYRQIAKLRNTYLDVLPKMVSSKTSRLHASFNQTMTATGRLSSSGPNLQNIPARNELGRQVRAAFVPAQPANVLLTADYSQIELRVLAHFSKDQQLCQAFANDQDIHTFVAGQIFGVDPQDVSSDQRSQAKTVNFGIIYGQTPFGLARSLGISNSEAHNFIEQYHQRYQGIRKFLEKCVKQARETGFVQTILGRRRRIRNIHDSNRAQKALAERTAINTVVQGSAADLMKVAMVNVHSYIKENCPDVKLLLQIHDELVFELPESKAAQHAQWIRRLMSRAIPLSVPVVVDIAWGRNWLESKYSA